MTLPTTSRILRVLTLSLHSTKYHTAVTRRGVSLKPNIITRSVHIHSSHHSNWDFGSPCECSEYREALWEPICQVCKTRPTVTQKLKQSWNRRGTIRYSLIPYCGQCWEEYGKEDQRRDQEERQKLVSQKAEINEMLEGLRIIESTEQVPLGYAVEKYKSDIQSHSLNSERWYRRNILDNLFQDLQIVKVGNKYMCSKRRVDAMDFKLWHSMETYMLMIKPRRSIRIYGPGSGLE
ncbi:hypothetical protein F5884DRAFT_826670 [Xylogone sp. PMI_703]|nr:hypothetical protein F5884DRAFT_826670 [Xylogone sp. PMI_703]